MLHCGSRCCPHRGRGAWRCTQRPRHQRNQRQNSSPSSVHKFRMVESMACSPVSARLSPLRRGARSYAFKGHPAGCRGSAFMADHFQNQSSLPCRRARDQRRGGTLLSNLQGTLLIKGICIVSVDRRGARRAASDSIERPPEMLAIRVGCARALGRSTVEFRGSPGVPTHRNQPDCSHLAHVDPLPHCPMPDKLADRRRQGAPPSGRRRQGVGTQHAAIRG
jgi:hypothetical protein